MQILANIARGGFYVSGVIATPIVLTALTGSLTVAVTGFMVMGMLFAWHLCK